MDRSFLSQPQVVAASRRFVCVRLSTYESAEEAAMLGKIFIGGSGQVENTTFALLAPDGRTPLCRPGRAAHWAFRDASHMASEMERIGSWYKGLAVGARDLPYVANVRLAVNVAASDGRPLIVLAASSESALRALEQSMIPIAWNASLRGRAVYARATSAADLNKIRGAAGQSGVLVVAPGAYGMDGALIQTLQPGPRLAANLDAALASYQPPYKDVHRHVGEGHKAGVYWETQIPETDPHARARGQR